MKENSICGDNRFEIIEKAKEMLLNATNIEDSKEEMKVLTNILFRMWQVGLINEEKLDKLNDTVADVLICIEQLEDLELVDKEKIQEWIDRKQILQNKQLNEINGTCEHCKLLSGDREILGENRDLELKIGRVNKDFYLEADTVENNVEVEINYCLFCGRKLGE